MHADHVHADHVHADHVHARPDCASVGPTSRRAPRHTNRRSTPVPPDATSARWRAAHGRVRLPHPDQRIRSRQSTTCRVPHSPVSPADSRPATSSSSPGSHRPWHRRPMASRRAPHNRPALQAWSSRRALPDDLRPAKLHVTAVRQRAPAGGRPNACSALPIRPVPPSRPSLGVSPIPRDCPLCAPRMVSVRSRASARRECRP